MQGGEKHAVFIFWFKELGRDPRDGFAVNFAASCGSGRDARGRCRGTV